MRPLIYISGPVSKGNWNDNLWAFNNVFERLVDLGFAPINPGWSMAYAGHHLIPHDVWLEIDLPQVARADAVFRITGESDGADRECELARELGIPIFVSTGDLLIWQEARKAVA